MKRLLRETRLDAGDCRLDLELELALGKWLGGNVEFVRHDLWQTHLAGFSLRKSLLEETRSSS